MAFPSGRTDEIGKIGAGEIIGDVGVVTSYNTFEEGLKGGLFAKFNTTSEGVELMDASATPVIAGVVKRDITGAIEDGGLYSADNNIYADVIESGLVTVSVRTGLTVNKFDTLYAYNTGADAGKATNAATDAVAIDGYFYKEIDTDVWAVRIK